MAINYHRMGQASKVVPAILAGLGVIAGAVLLGFLLPSGASAGVAMGLIFATRSAAKSLQGAAVDEHIARGGQLASKWGAFSVGMAVLGVIVGAIFLGAWATTATAGTKVMIGEKDNIFYSGSSTEAEAKALGDSLKRIGFFTDRGVSVLLSKGKEGTIVTFIVKEGAWDKPEMVSVFENIGRQVAPSVGGPPITVRLADTMRQTKKEIAVASEK
jgi:hypothetical protein